LRLPSRGGGAKTLVELDPEKTDGLIQRCKDQLFPENQSCTRWSDVLERAASNPRWIWLPWKGMEEIKAAALADGRWVEENGYVAKSLPPPKPLVRVTRAISDTTSVDRPQAHKLHILKRSKSSSQRRHANCFGGPPWLLP
jgi:hypothetical protein